MMKWKVGVAVFISALAVLGVVAVGEVIAPQDTAVEDGAGAKGLFYTVDGGANDVYLFGSIHFGNEEMYPLHGTVEDAFQRSDVLVMELDMAAKSQDEISQEMREWGTYDDRRMTDVVRNDTFETVYDTLGPYGYTRDEVNRMKPWYAANKISKKTMHKAGYDPEQDVESYFVELAGEQDKTVKGLETVDDQGAAFDTLSPESGEIYALNTISGYDAGGPYLNRMASDWVEGSETAFAQQRQVMRGPSQTASMDAFYNALLDEREERMSDKITALLENDSNQTYFVAVGSLHLVGENSIPDNLEDNGYTVTRVYR